MPYAPQDRAKGGRASDANRRPSEESRELQNQLRPKLASQNTKSQRVLNQRSGKNRDAGQSAEASPKREKGQLP